MRSKSTLIRKLSICISFTVLLGLLVDFSKLRKEKNSRNTWKQLVALFLPLTLKRCQLTKKLSPTTDVDPNAKAWKLWEAEQWVPPKRLAFSQLLIPTIDSTRAEFIIKKIAGLPAMRSEKRKENG
jgi:hypothetical protein